MIRIAIVEDEQLYADQLAEYMTEKILRFRISRSMTSF